MTCQQATVSEPQAPDGPAAMAIAPKAAAEGDPGCLDADAAMLERATRGIRLRGPENASRPGASNGRAD